MHPIQITTIRPPLCLLAIGAFFALALTSPGATVRYVAQMGQTPDTSLPPVYTSRETASSNIQSVVKIAEANDIIHIGSVLTK